MKNYEKVSFRKWICFEFQRGFYIQINLGKNDDHYYINDGKDNRLSHGVIGKLRRNHIKGPTFQSLRLSPFVSNGNKTKNKSKKGKLSSSFKNTCFEIEQLFVKLLISY